MKAITLTFISSCLFLELLIFACHADEKQVLKLNTQTRAIIAALDATDHNLTQRVSAVSSSEANPEKSTAADVIRLNAYRH